MGGLGIMQHQRQLQGGIVHLAAVQLHALEHALQGIAVEGTHQLERVHLADAQGLKKVFFLGASSLSCAQADGVSESAPMNSCSKRLR